MTILTKEQFERFIAEHKQLDVSRIEKLTTEEINESIEKILRDIKSKTEKRN